MVEKRKAEQQRAAAEVQALEQLLELSTVAENKGVPQETLAERLSKEAPQINLPTLPPKKFWGNMAPVFVRQRKEQLDQWLEDLLEVFVRKAFTG